MTATPTPTPLSGIAPLPHLGVILAQGADAATFLHGQLSQDFSLLSAHEARLAGFLSAKGRMQASFVGLRHGPTDILLICSRDLLAATLKRLAMFVMRAKCQLSDATDAFTLRGLAGDAVPAAAGLAGGAGDALPWSVTDAGGASVVHLYPAAGQPRALWIAPAEHAVPTGAALPLDTWQWGEVMSGIATLSQPLVDAFVPQMLNFESVGGVNFKKGCYPGQEVVARSQFRGTLKRRLYLGQTSVPAAAGDPVFQGCDDEQPCGTVVQAATSPDGTTVLQISLQIAAASAGDLRLEGAAGAPITLAALPYPLLDDI